MARDGFADLTGSERWFSRLFGDEAEPTKVHAYNGTCLYITQVDEDDTEHVIVINPGEIAHLLDVVRDCSEWMKQQLGE